MPMSWILLSHVIIFFCTVIVRVYVLYPAHTIDQSTAKFPMCCAVITTTILVFTISKRKKAMLDQPGQTESVKTVLYKRYGNVANTVVVYQGRTVLKFVRALQTVRGKLSVSSMINGKGAEIIIVAITHKTVAYVI